jgi:hypothetical protein
VGVSIARVLVGVIGLLMFLGGIAVAAGGGATLPAALFLIVPGTVLLAGVILERTRYRSLDAERSGAGHGPGGGEPGPAAPRFRPTEERFVDPTTGVPMRVYTDVRTGERRYVPEG